MREDMIQMVKNHKQVIVITKEGDKIHYAWDTKDIDERNRILSKVLNELKLIENGTDN